MSGKEVPRTPGLEEDLREWADVWTVSGESRMAATMREAASEIARLTAERDALLGAASSGEPEREALRERIGAKIERLAFRLAPNWTETDARLAVFTCIDAVAGEAVTDAGAAPAEREGLQKAAERALAMLDAFNRLTFNIGVGREAREIAESLREALAAAPREQEPRPMMVEGRRPPLLCGTPEPPAPGETRVKVLADIIATEFYKGGRGSVYDAAEDAARKIIAQDAAPTGEAARLAGSLESLAQLCGEPWTTTLHAATRLLRTLKDRA